jgi:TolB-like protein/tetratricopeptide (TPR) repeat protein
MSMNDARSGSAEGTHTVFVSYAHEDAVRAQELITGLEQAGFRVWWDRLIVAGAVFAASTEQALESASVIVVLWSQSSVTSHWVRDEATWGRDRQRLVPVSLDGTEPPLGFRQHLFIDLSEWKGEPDAPQFHALLQAIGALHGEPPTPVAPPRPLQAPPRTNRRALLAGSAALAVAALGGGWYAWRRAARERTSNGVAVLPFVNMSGDATQTYFTDGMAAEVRAALSRTRFLRVIAQVSSEAFRDAHLDAPAIADALGVAFLLEGNMRRSGSTFRITTELIDGRTGFSRWGQTFDRPIDNVFEVQSEIARSVVEAVAAEVHHAGEPAANFPERSPGGTTNVAAYDAYLRGLVQYKRSENEASERQALAAFDAAILADPEFAAAHAARARTLEALANDYVDAPRMRETKDAALHAAETAVSLAPNSADAQSTLAIVLFQGRLDVRGARRPYELAYRLGAGDGPVVARYALYASQVGRADEAAPAMARALELDPLNPLMHSALASTKYLARRYVDVMPPANRALALNPKLSDVHATIGAALLALGRFSEAQEAFVAEPTELLRLPGLAILAQRRDDTKGAEAALATLRTEVGDSGLYQQAQVLAQFGRLDAALEVLARARSLDDSGLTLARTDPLLDPLRSRKEFSSLLQQLGFD